MKRQAKGPLTGYGDPTSMVHLTNRLLSKGGPHAVEVVQAKTKGITSGILDLAVDPLNDFQKVAPRIGKEPDATAHGDHIMRLADDRYTATF